MTTTITRADIADKINSSLGLPFNESSMIVDSIVDEMSDIIVVDGILKLSGFGTFHVRHKNERMGRNPRTKEETVISARDVVVLQPSRNLTKFINK